MGGWVDGYRESMVYTSINEKNEAYQLPLVRTGGGTRS